MTGVAFRAHATPAGDVWLNGAEFQQHERGLLVVRLWCKWWPSELRHLLWFRASMNSDSVRADEPVLD